MKKIIVPIVILFYLTACMKGGKCDGGVLHDVAIIYVDSLGNNPFTNTSKCLSLDSIRVYDLQNNSSSLEIRYYNSEKNVIDIVTSNVFINNYNRNLIHLKAGINDTLICHYSGVANEGCLNIDSVWYNGILCTNNVTTAFTIVKKKLCD
jgi:hypothetical protein